MELKLSGDWEEAIGAELQKDYFQKLKTFLEGEYRENTVYPPVKNIFNALNYCSPQEVKAVILGQDPYHGPKQANGLAFSVNPGVKIPPSLKNIFKEIKQEYGVAMPDNGDLTHWAEQGVLLLNATLTVRAGEAGSHQKQGWETFTNAIIKYLAGNKKQLVYLLWGSFAHKKEEFILADHNLILKAVHPSPLSANRGFFGCNHFKKCNEYLEGIGKKPIQWVKASPTLFDGQV